MSMCVCGEEEVIARDRRTRNHTIADATPSSHHPADVTRLSCVVWAAKPVTAAELKAKIDILKDQILEQRTPGAHPLGTYPYT